MGILAPMPKGEHTGKRGPKEKPAELKKTKEFRVGCTPADHARFMEAGGSEWALAILQKALRKRRSDSPPQPSPDQES